MEWLFILARIVGAAYANVYQKRLTRSFDALSIVLLGYAALVLLTLPLWWLVNLTELTHDFWWMMGLAATLDMAGTVLLVRSLSATDLSVFGPLNAYKVVLSLILAWLLLHEVPSLWGLMGIGVIVLGSFILLPPRRTGSDRLTTLLSHPGVRYRLGSIALFSIGTLPLKQALLSGGVLATTLFWCVFGFVLMVGVYRLLGPQTLRAVSQQASAHGHRFVLMGGCILVMQFFTLLILSQMLIAYALALFQLSMVLQVILGRQLFDEPHFRARMLACLVMIAGSLMVLYT